MTKFELMHELDIWLTQSPGPNLLMAPPCGNGFRRLLKAANRFALMLLFYLIINHAEGILTQFSDITRCRIFLI